MLLLFLNGPNLGRLGHRAPEVYGTSTLSDVVATCRERAGAAGWNLTDYQTNHEGQMVDRLEQRDYDAVVINPGAWSHYSYALYDALAACDVPVVEVHISNIYEREAFRHLDILSPIVDHQIVGRGVAGYQQAVEWVIANVGARRVP